MKKADYLQMLIEENNDTQTQKLYSDVIDCLDIGLSQESDDFEIEDTSIGLKELFGMIEKKASAKGSGAKSVGPFEVAEMFAKKFGAKYTRLSKRTGTTGTQHVRLEDFL